MSMPNFETLDQFSKLTLTKELRIFFKDMNIKSVNCYDIDDM